MNPLHSLAKRALATTLAATLAGTCLLPATGARAGDNATATATPAPATPAATALRIRAAEHRPGATSASLLAAARAGQRLVAVGERGTVLLSDDGGTRLRQARQVPVSAQLTGVDFANERRGWAVGHWGAILRTDDGGDTWALQRSDLQHDQPLLAIKALDAQRAVAVGLWSLVLVTQDGGQSWQQVSLASQAGARQADLNLYGLFSGPAGELYATAEQGKLLRSSDGGLGWQMLDTGYRGSLWTGLALRDGSLLVGGLRGTLLRSTNAGASWQPVHTGQTSSITGLAQAADGGVVASALDGLVLSSGDGQRFTARRSADRLSFTGVLVDAQGQTVLISRAGVRRQLP